MDKKFNQAAYTADYNKKNYDRVELKLPRGMKTKWQEEAKAEGLSLTEYIMQRVEGADMKEIYRSFDILEAGEQESGYKVYKEGDGYLVKHYSLGSKTTMFRLKRPIDWTDPLVIGEAEIYVNNGCLEGAAHYKGRWWSTERINQIQRDRQDYNWRAYV